MANEYQLSYTANDIDNRLGMVGNAILYTEQNLTEEQKAQARANIGAGSLEDAPPKFVDSIAECIDITREYVLPDGYIYRYMQELPIITYETHDEKQWANHGVLKDSNWVVTKNTNIIPVTEGD